jgi:hypothetical protein
LRVWRVCSAGSEAAMRKVGGAEAPPALHSPRPPAAHEAATSPAPERRKRRRERFWMLVVGFRILTSKTAHRSSAETLRAEKNSVHSNFLGVLVRL